MDQKPIVEEEKDKKDMTKGPAEDKTEALEFNEMNPSEGNVEDSKGLEFLLDVPLEITVELGRTTIQIGELLKLGQGSVVELEKLTNEPVEIYVNQKLMARGEVVVVNEKFGVRLTNIISPGERVKNLV